MIFSELIVNKCLILYPAEVPDAPEPPKPDRVTKDNVTLSWRPPRSDGGKKIKEYVIEKKKKNDKDWSPAGQTPGNNTIHTVGVKVAFTTLINYVFIFIIIVIVYCCFCCLG